MTEPRPENRVRTSKLCDWFQHHKNKILALEPFAATDIPDKVK